MVNDDIDISGIVLNPTPEAWANLQAENGRLTEQLEQMTRNWKYASDAKAELTQKIENVKGLIRDYISAGDEIEDQTKEICELLDIELTKTISGTATYEISWSATVPLDFDADDFDISFDVNCESYEADDFDWNEDNCEVHGEDE